MTSRNYPQYDASEEDDIDTWLNSPDLQAIDWSKVEIEGELYDGPPGDPSVYSDLEDLSKHSQNTNNPNNRSGAHEK